MRPEEGAISPAATLSKVDLPQPVGPTIAMNSPAATASEASSTAGYVPPAASRNLTLTCESETAGGIRRARRRGRRDQFRLRSTNARCLIHGIIARSLAPISSIGCVAILARMALNDVWLTRFSSIQSLTNLPDWMSSRIFFISARVASLTTRGPETYSPYSAVLETE